MVRVDGRWWERGGGKSKVMSEPANEFIMGKVGVVGKRSFSVRLGTTPARFWNNPIIIAMTRPAEHFTNQIPEPIVVG